MTISISEQHRYNTVYFAQHRTDALIKIGVTSDLGRRMQSLSRARLITSIPGSLTRELALHWALSPWRAKSEWYCSDPAVWRVVLEALDGGDLPWLPTYEGDRVAYDGRRVVAEATEYFGSRKAMCAALDYTVAAIGSVIQQTYFPASFWGRYAMERAIREGIAPAYLRPERRQMEVAA